MRAAAGRVHLAPAPSLRSTRTVAATASAGATHDMAGMPAHAADHDVDGDACGGGACGYLLVQCGSSQRLSYRCAGLCVQTSESAGIARAHTTT